MKVQLQAPALSFWPVATQQSYSQLPTTATQNFPTSPLYSLPPPHFQAGPRLRPTHLLPPRLFPKPTPLQYLHTLTTPPASAQLPPPLGRWLPTLTLPLGSSLQVLAAKSPTRPAIFLSAFHPRVMHTTTETYAKTTPQRTAACSAPKTSARAHATGVRLDEVSGQLPKLALPSIRLTG